MIYLGVEKRGTREGSCRTFRTESHDGVNGISDLIGERKKRWGSRRTME